jgi:hypothetical protein
MVGGVASFGCRCRQGERQQSRLSWRPFAGRRARESICLLNPIDGRIAFVRACSPPGRPATLLASIRWNVTPPCPRCTVISRSRKIWVQTPRRGCEASVLRAGLMRGRGGQKKRKENGAGRGTATRSPCRHANLAREEVAHSV